MKIGVIGCGAIGSVLCKFIDRELPDKLIGICDIDKDKARKLSRKLKTKVKSGNIKITQWKN